MRKPNYTKVSSIISGIHSEFEINEPPINPIRIAREKGVQVTFVEFSGDANRISGFFDVEEHSIYVNKNEYPLRQTFTVAHELGHAIMHSEWAASDDYQMLFRDAEYDGNDPYEKEANAFAAHLLVPRFLLDKYWSNYPVEQLSKIFAVSVPMIKNRLSFEYGI